MAPRGRQVVGGSPQDEDAKNMFDRIGKDVYDQVKKEAETYKDELKGDLNTANGHSSETASTIKTCALVDDYYNNHVNGNSERQPCKKDAKGIDVDRFSDKEGAECDNRKIEGNSKISTDKDVGACAPYRRLYLCNKNIVKMDTNNDDSKAKHDLLAEVCMAAKYEGQTITRDYPLYQQKYPDSPSQLCSVLARSFADIGDIVRGRDLYRGSGRGKGKTKLQDKLKKIFEKIHSDVTKTNGEAAKERYKDTDNYYELREDWWTANRDQVWKAMTCSEDLNNSSYFRKTCSDVKGESVANHYCRCNGDKPGEDKPSTDPPTYFDYVPQYLRWFEEWAEDFCLKKKKKLENLQKQCRGKDKNDQQRYCSRNGYDCEKTKLAIGKYRMGKGCTDCFFACNPYIDWINNQKEQFDKQRKKYQNEIVGSSKKKGGAGGTTKYDGYESKFYNILKNDGYVDVNGFLGLLNNEKACQAITDTEGGKIDFKIVNSDSTAASVRAVSGGTSDTSGTNDENKGTFYRSKYCQPCPFCGMKMGNNGNFVKKSVDDKCRRGNFYKTKDGAEATPIRILKSGEGEKDIIEKLNAFCQTQNGSDITSGGEKNSGSKELYQEWKCYKGDDIEKNGEEEDDDDEDEDEVHASGVCILKNEKENKSEKEPDEFQKSFYDFFYYWVAHMLKDSIHWRTKRIKRCINNASGNRCRNGCNTKCDCFLKWVEQKEKEWKEIKDHFGKQKAFKNGGDGLASGVFVLQYNLKEEFMKKDSEEKSENSLDAEDAEELKHLQKILKLDEKNTEELGDAKEQKTIMDKLIEHEEEIATKCKDCKKAEDKDLGRSETPREDTLPPAEKDDHFSGDEDDESEDEDEPVETAKEDTKQDESEATEKELPAPPVDNVTPACKIVDDLFQNPSNFSDACTLKYAPGGKENFPNWKCVPTSGGDNSTTREGSESAGHSRARRSVLKPSVGSGEPPTAESEAPSGVTTTGAICVPPRRRRLYIQKLHDWANSDEATKSRAQLDIASTSTTESSLLRDAFIESAAVETFFLWHKYKKEWELQKNKPQNGELYGFGGGGGPFGGSTELGDMQAVAPGVGVQPQLSHLQNGGPGGPVGSPLLQNSEGDPQVGSLPLIRLGDSRGSPEALVVPEGARDDDGDPNTELKRGNIPIDFLRLMFYTLGDYRDICVGNTPNGIDTVSASSSGKDKDGGVSTTKISEKIQKILNGDNNKQATGVPPSPSGENPRKKWWEANGEHIWNAMVCALTYKDNDAKDQPPTQNEEVKKALLDTDGKKPKSGGKYEYKNVKLEEENSGTDGPKAFNAETPSPASDNTPTTLTNFISRPPYFRYLEEWGENFCKERKKRLEQIKEDCQVEENDYGRRGPTQKTPKCSCYGEHCQDNLNKDPSIVSDLDCPSCGRECRKYRKWIETKRKEFEEQEKKYDTELNYAKSNSHNNGFYTTLEKTSPKATEFLKNLGPCKSQSVEANKTIFDNIGETFQHAKDCKSCSEFKVKCDYGNCTGTNGDECKNNKINKEDIENEEKFTDQVDMLVIDNSTKQFEGDLENDCKDAGIFTGIRKDEWKCGKVCGYNVCKAVKVNGKTFDGKSNGENQIIIIRALVTHWVHNFLEDYKKIKHKISHCTNNAEGITCISGCDKKCKCVGQWIEKKRGEWGKIKNHYKKQNENGDNNMTSLVTNVLEELLSQIAAANDKKKFYDKLDKLEVSLGCNCTDNSQTTGDEDVTKEDNDLVLCMLRKLGEKATSCKEKHQNSGSPEVQCQESSPEPDDEPFEEEENPANTVGKQQPSFCPPQTPPKQEEEDEKCEAPVAPSKDEKPKGDQDSTPAEETEQTNVIKPEKEAPTTPKVPTPRKPPRRKPPKDLAEHPAVIPSLATSTLMWTVGIGFAAFTYFFLKKKTKSSVGNLFQILQIPKSDYDIPTLKSSNRYIPYASDRHKGKTYIYMEGDSSGDEKYAFMSDTTDVTSSESEYEELDVNDIYVPGSPKYKTLIEVVLEPSKRDIQNDIPSGDTPNNKLTDNEWNQLKKDFISNMLQNTQNTEPNILHDNVDNNTHPTMSRHKVDQKPFIMSIHDRNLYIGQEYSYDMSTNSGENNLYSGIDPTSANHDSYSGNHHPYSGIDLINDALNGDYDIYDEILKRKENELFGTNHVKHTSTHSVAKNTNSDPILNQINLFHKWLDRHRNICEEWDKNKVELLDKLKEEWNKENNNNGDKTYNSDNKPSHNHVLNTDVSIQIDMDNPKPKNEFTNMDTTPNKSTMDTMLDDLEKYNEPYYYDFYEDDIYYDVNDDDKTSMDNNNNLVDKNNPVDSNSSTYNHHNPADINKTFVDINNHNQHPIEKPTKIQIEMNSNNREVIEQQYPIADIWNI
ncbi:erythrocyte membrane protein 1, PfEMP1 [Plasmodium sp. gorilla clade G1]|nr:erythrocyte membrane protein 1, PfEMP1 [Plasmodium sp. gorilla clade G1]